MNFAGIKFAIFFFCFVTFFLHQQHHHHLFILLLLCCVKEEKNNIASRSDKSFTIIIIFAEINVAINPPSRTLLLDMNKLKIGKQCRANDPNYYNSHVHTHYVHTVKYQLDNFDYLHEFHVVNLIRHKMYQ